MAEPSTITAAAATLVSWAAVASALPMINIDAAFGAVLGAALVASTRKDLSAWKRFVSFIFSVLCGYGGAGEFIAQGWAKQAFFPALLGSLIIVPLALKLSEKTPEIDINEVRSFVVKLFGGRL